MTGKSQPEMKALLVYPKRDRGSVTQIANKLGNPAQGAVNDWLILTPKDKMPKPEVVAYPKPPKAADGSLMYERIPNKVEPEKPSAPISMTTVPMNVSTGATVAPVAAGPTPSAASAQQQQQPQTSSLKRRHDDINGLDSKYCSDSYILK